MSGAVSSADQAVSADSFVPGRSLPASVHLPQSTHCHSYVPTHDQTGHMSSL